MTKRYFRQWQKAEARKAEDGTAATRSQPLDEMEAQVQARTLALQQENERLRAELQAHQQVEATLRQREEQFRALINNVPGAVYRAAFDDDWTLAFISDAIAKLSGYPAADFINNKAQNFNTICHPDDLEPVKQTIHAAIAAKQPFVVEYRNIRADGQVIWVCEQGHGVYNTVGEGIWVDGVVLDITNLKQTEEALRRSEERLKLIADALPVCISYLDREQRFQFVNKTYESWFGLSAAEIYGKQLAEVLGNAAYQLIQGHVERALAGEAVTYERELPYQHGGSRYVSGLLMPDVDEQQQVQGYYALVMDISAQQAALRERKAAEDAVKQQAERERLLNAIAQRIRQSLNLDDILNTTVQEIRLLLQTDRVIICRFQPNDQGIVTVESVGSGWRSLLGNVLVAPGLTIEGFRQRQSQGKTIVADIYTAELEASYLNMLIQYQVRANMVLPILVGNEFWGLLVVDHCTAPRVWQPWEVELLTQLATQLAIAIQQSELFQQVQQLNTVLQEQIQEHITQLQQALAYEALLKRITDSVRDSLDESQIFQTAVRELAIELQLHGCSGGLYDFEQQVLTITYEHICHDLPSALGRQLSITAEPDIYGQMLQGQHLQFCPLPEFSNVIRPIQSKYTILACPIFIAAETGQSDGQPEMIGDLWLFRLRDTNFNEMEIRLVKQVTNQCAIAIRQARLYQAVQAQVTELERLNQLKDDFLSTVSHELRTPMSSIKMATQMLEVTLFQNETDNTVDEPEAVALVLPPSSVQKINRYFQILKDEGDREIRLINDLLDLSRLDSGRDPLFLSTLHLQIWLPHVAESFLERTAAQQQSLAIAVAPELPAMTTDFSYLERIVTELLQNACKYTPRGETVTLLAQTVALPAKEPKQVKDTATNSHTLDARPFSDRLSNPRPFSDRLSSECVSLIEVIVTNSGIEISAAERDRIFDKFYRIPHGDPWKHGGTGLGLALVKKLVERLNGKIWVESGNSQTSFVLQFPSVLR